MLLLLLPFFALFFASLSSAARIDLFRHQKSNSTDLKPGLLSLVNKYAAISRRHFNRTGAVSYTHLTLPTIYSV